MLSLNYETRACKKWRGTRTVPYLRGNFSGIMIGNYPWIITGNYERERWKARSRVNSTLRLMLSPNYGTRACKKRRGTRTVPSLRGKSLGIMSGNYPWIIWELLLRIISGNYYLVYQWRRKVEIYRDTGVSKNIKKTTFTFWIQSLSSNWFMFSSSLKTINLRSRVFSEIKRLISFSVKLNVLLVLI